MEHTVRVGDGTERTRGLAAATHCPLGPRRGQHTPTAPRKPWQGSGARCGPSRLTATIYNFLFFPTDFDANNIFKAFFGGPGGFSFEGRWRCPTVGFGGGKCTDCFTQQQGFPSFAVLLEESMLLLKSLQTSGVVRLHAALRKLSALTKC